MERCEAGDRGSENHRKILSWCLHCERVYSAEAWDRNGGRCPGPGCDGDVWDRHTWPWVRSRLRLLGRSEYPRKPAEGAHFPLY
jgi:hypothetical protein